MATTDFVTYRQFIATMIGFITIGLGVVAYIQPIGRAEYKNHLEAEAENNRLIYGRLDSLNDKMDDILTAVKGGS